MMINWNIVGAIVKIDTFHTRIKIAIMTFLFSFLQQQNCPSDDSNT